MVKRIFSLLFLIIISGIIFSTCKRELHPSNQIPIAYAGKDTIIVLPIDFVKLEGSASRDPDGSIKEWNWTKISGPSNFTIGNAKLATTDAKNLIAGVYQFELKVTDNGGLSAKDTVQVTVASAANHAPVANAGKDTSIILPASSVTLDGAASFDPDKNITSYSWTKISGPSSNNIANASSVQTQAINLVEGIYQFELKVTDAGGLFSKDTVQVTISPAANTACDNSDRPIVNAQIIPMGSLSQPNFGMAVASAGNKILFAGGHGISTWGTTRVDIYDIATQTWSTAELSKARWGIAAVAVGNKIFFAGGEYGDGAFDDLYSTVDIYDVSSNSWSVAALSQPRSQIAAAAVGDKVFFAGGGKDFYDNGSDVVDSYDVSSNEWSKAKLSAPRLGIAAVSVNNTIYFAGGAYTLRGFNNGSDKIDIYDNFTESWSTSSLVQAKAFSAAIAMSGQIYWAGGLDEQTTPGTSCTVEIQNVTTKISTISYLSKPDYWNIDEGNNAVVKDNKIIFLRNNRIHSGGNINNLDIYDLTTNTWSIGILPLRLSGASIISVNNTIYMAGGFVNGVLSKQVWKLEF